MTPEEDPGVTEEKEIGDLLMQMENANLRFAFLLCFLNLLQEAQGVTTEQRQKDRASEEILGPGAYKEKSHIVEGPQYLLYIQNLLYNFDGPYGFSYGVCGRLTLERHK